MKKSLVALAVLGLSGVAMAQSNVTLYGVADAGVGRAKSSGDLKTHFLGAGLMNNGDSRVGVKGTEDMGGGLQAGFNFETGLSLKDGAATAGGLSNGFWQRQANVFVGGPWGAVKLGRQFTPSYLANSTYELTGEANYTVVGNTYKWVGVTDRRAPSAFAYVSPTLSGVTAAVGYITKKDLGLSKDVWDAAVLYGNGPISAGFGVNKLGNSKTNYQLGGKYDFGGFAVAASYTSASLPESKAVRRGFGLGGSATFGAASVVVDLSRDTKNAWDASRKKYTNGLVEGKYALSKRTSLYAAYLRLDKQNNWGLGLHHNF
ncbi:MAG: porin [Burkholderiaceae bacterium]|jgi:predicted porin|nr:porin [Burkholderiaceae bacterium]